MKNFICLERAAYDVWTAINIDHIVRFNEDGNKNTCIILNEMKSGESSKFTAKLSFDEVTRLISAAQKS